MRLNSRIQQKQDTAANWKNNNPVLLSGEFGYETDTGKVKIGNGSSHWNDIDYVGKDELPTDPTFNSLVVGGESSTSGSANLIADEIGVTIAKNESVINLNEEGVDIQSSDIHLAADNGVLSVTAGSWPAVTLDNSDGWSSTMNIHVGDFNLLTHGFNGHSSLSFDGGLNLYGSSINIDGETNLNGETTFLYTPCILNGSDGKIELVDKNFLEERLSSIAPSESANFKSLTVGGSDDSSASGSGSANLIADEMGVTITKNDSAVDVNEDGIDIQSTNIHLAADNGTLSITAGSWPVLTIDNSSEWNSKVNMLVGDLGLTAIGMSGPTELNFSCGLDLSVGNTTNFVFNELNLIGNTTNFNFSELNINSETTFQYIPCVSNGSDKVELVDKNYLEEKLENIGFPEVFDSLHVSHNDSLSATTLDVTSDGIQAYSTKDTWISGHRLTLHGDEVVFPNGSDTAMRIVNDGASHARFEIYGDVYVNGEPLGGYPEIIDLLD